MARRDPDIEGNFICKACGDSKSRSEYYNSSQDGVSAYCKICTRSKVKAWKSTDRGKARSRESHLRTKYGVSIDDYNALFILQEGKCYICQNVLDAGKQTHVDHHHKSGFVRGLLCHHCNLMIGHAMENPDILRAGAMYLENYEFVRVAREMQGIPNYV